MAKASQAAKKKKVVFSVLADPGSAVSVAGSFNGWDPKKNKLRWQKNRFQASVSLDKGRYEYKFVINDVWCIDPECPEWVPNDMGTLNSVMNVE